MADIVSKGSGSVYGIDASPAMIESARKAAEQAEVKKCTFEVVDALELVNTPSIQQGVFTTAFSNAAMHWILRPESKREDFFRGVGNALAPNAKFAFEMGGLGNVSEMRGAMLQALARRIGLKKAVEIDPWFFPDEGWMVDVMENKVGGWKVERVEREYRPTMADEGGVNGWIRLMGKRFFQALPEEEREECIREVVDVLEVVCAVPGGGYNFGYVRLRVLARKL